MKIKYIFGAIAITFFIPILLNVILGSNNPFQCITIVGDSTHWLGFYGSYIGGVLTAVIGFITLSTESKRNKIQLEIRSREDALKELKLALAESVALFDFCKVTEISLFAKDSTMYNTIQKELSEYHSLLVTQANAWGAIYAASKQLEVVRFKNAYIDCYEAFDDCINSMTKAIYYLSEAKSEKGRADIILKQITPITEKNSFIRSKIQTLYEMAQKWIEAEEKEIKNLKGAL